MVRLDEEFEAQLCRDYIVWIAERGTEAVAEGLEMPEAEVLRSRDQVMDYSYLSGHVRQRMEIRSLLAKAAGVPVGDRRVDVAAKQAYRVLPPLR